MNSELYLKTIFRNNQTDIEDMFFTPPYKITSPFKNGTHSDIMIMSASAGILGGDKHVSDFVIGENSDVSIISQSYEKVMDTHGDTAIRETKITVCDNAKLVYIPYPVIPFKNSDYRSDTEINIKRSSALIYTDIFSCGRVGMGEEFLMNSFVGKVIINIEDKIVFADNTVITPKKFRYNSIGQWDKYTHNGLMYIYLPTIDNDKITEEIRKIKANNFEIAVSKALVGLSVRMLANSGDEIYSVFQEIADIMSKKI